MVITWKAGRGKTIKEVKEAKDRLGGPWNSHSMLSSAREAEAKLESSQSYSFFLLVPSRFRLL